MNRGCILSMIVLVWLTFWGCSGAQSPARAIWTTLPESFEVDNQLFEATLTPKKGEYPFFTFFHLKLSNKSNADLIVDWNASQYVFNGKPQGVLVFEGIDPETIKAATVPTDTVAPGAVFTRDVMPLRLIAWSPIREKSPGRGSITPGMLPAGQNGIRLAVRHANAQMTIPLNVQIQREDTP